MRRRSSSSLKTQPLASAVFDRALPRVCSPEVDEIVSRSYKQLRPEVDAILRREATRYVEHVHLPSGMAASLIGAATRGLCIGRSLLDSEDIAAAFASEYMLEPAALAHQAWCLKSFGIALYYLDRTQTTDLSRALDNLVKNMARGLPFRARFERAVMLFLHFGLDYAFVECNEILLKAPELLTPSHTIEGEYHQDELSELFPRSEQPQPRSETCAADDDVANTRGSWSLRRSSKYRLPVFEIGQLRIAIKRDNHLLNALSGMLLYDGVIPNRFRVTVTSAVDGKELWSVGGYEVVVPVELFERVCEVLQREQLGASPERVEAVLDHARQELFR